VLSQVYFYQNSGKNLLVRRHEEITDRVASQEQKRKLKQIHKAYRGHYKFRHSNRAGVP